MPKRDEDIGLSGSREVRRKIEEGEFRFRGQKMEAKVLGQIKRALWTLHNLEIMAVNIYRLQIGRVRSDLDLQLIVAMCNEMCHVQDFQVKLFEYGWKPSRLRWAFWGLGFLLGLGSRMLGRRLMLVTAIWLEEKAANHYARLLEGVEWEPDVRGLLTENLADEEGHIRRWQRLISSP